MPFATKACPSAKSPRPLVGTSNYPCSLPAEEFTCMLSRILSADMPASSTFTRELLGWEPTHFGLIEDIDQGHFFA